MLIVVYMQHSSMDVIRMKCIKQRGERSLILTKLRALEVNLFYVYLVFRINHCGQPAK